MFTRLDTIIVRVRDLAAARAWYANALGLDAVFTDETEELAVLGMNGTSLTLWQLKPDEAPPAGNGSYPIFGVADAAAAQARLRERGVATEPLQEGAGVRFFGFHDLDGNRLEACEVVTG